MVSAPVVVQTWPVAGRLELSRLNATSRYECALSYDLPAHVAGEVEALRRELALPAPPEHQMFPHLTLLYVGRIEAKWLLELDTLFRGVEFDRVRISVGGRLDTFSVAGRTINVHLPVSPPDAVRAAHRRALSAFQAHGWVAQTGYIDQHYVPHVSVFDRTDLDASARLALGRYRAEPWQVDLERPLWIGRPVPPGLG